MALLRSRTAASNQKADKYVHDIESAFSMDRCADPDGFLSKLKPLFKECPEMRTVPVPYRGEVTFTQIADLMQVIDFEAGSVVIPEGNVNPDLYIVLRGSLEGKSAKTGSFRHGILFKPFDAVGFVTPLTQTEWVTCTVRALERTKVVVVQREELVNFVERINHIKEKTELREFVIATVPGARYLGIGGKEKVMGYFEVAGFKKGDVLLREGQISDFAYIIRSGECLKTTSDFPRKPRRLSPLKIHSPMSPSSLVLSLISPKQWVGEECLIYDTPLEYSVVATNKVTALRIHRSNFTEKLPKETIQALTTNVDSKRAWKVERQTRIKETISKVAKEDEESNQARKGQQGERVGVREQRETASLLKSRIYDREEDGGMQSEEKLTPGGSFFLTEKPKRGLSVSPLKSIEIRSSFKDWNDGLPADKAAFFHERNPFASRTPSLKVVHIARIPSTKSVRKSLSPTKLSILSVRDHFGYNRLPDARVTTPNPTTLWLKKRGVDPSLLVAQPRVSKEINEF